MKTAFNKALVSVAVLVVIGATAQAGVLPRDHQGSTTLPELVSQTRPALVQAIATPQAKTDIVPFAVAPPLSAMWVYAVGSTDCGWEETAGLVTTTCNHGGAQLRVAVLEIGYGSSGIVTANGGVLPSSAMYASTMVCLTGSYYTWPCTPGQTVVGFLKEYSLDGLQSAFFKYQNTSLNSPWNSMSVQISVL